MRRPTAACERLFRGIGSRLIDQMLMLANDRSRSYSLRFVAGGKKPPAKSDSARMDEQNDRSEPFSNRLQSLGVLFRLCIYSWIHAVPLRAWLCFIGAA
jgi:hypothetical protein